MDPLLGDTWMIGRILETPCSTPRRKKFFSIDRCSSDLRYWQKEKKTGFSLYVKHNTYNTCYSKRYYTSLYELHFFVCRFGVTYRGKIGDDIEVRVGNAVERLVSVPSHIKHQKEVRKIGAIWGHFLLVRRYLSSSTKIIEIALT